MFEKYTGSVCCGFIMGVIFMGYIMNNFNRDFYLLWSDLIKSQEICESFNSKPSWIDLEGELVCANGAVVDYNEFGGE